MKTHINLLPWQFRYSMLRRARMRQWSFVGVVTLVLLTGTWYWKTRQAESARHSLAVRERIAQPVHSVILETDRLQRKLSELQERRALLGELDAERVPFHMIGVVSQGTKDCKGRVAVRKLDLTLIPGAPVDTAKPDGKPSRNNFEMTLDGIATDNLAVSNFVMHLRKSGLFDHVELRSSSASSGTQDATRLYKIVCRL